MTKEELIKNQFPNDEFLQSAVSQIVDKCTADLQSECRTCVYTDSPCVRSDYPSKDGVCSHYKNVFDENVELKQENKVLAQNLEDTEILNKTYEKRFSDLKKENAELTTKVTALENANRAMVKELDDTTSGGLNILQNVVKNKEELTKAKEIIKDLLYFLKKYYTEDIPECMDKAEQFLKESDIDGAIRQANEGLDFDKIADEMEQDLKDCEVEK